jgi:hypothetical protein
MGLWETFIQIIAAYNSIHIKNILHKYLFMYLLYFSEFNVGISNTYYSGLFPGFNKQRVRKADMCFAFIEHAFNILSFYLNDVYYT